MVHGAGDGVETVVLSPLPSNLPPSLEVRRGFVLLNGLPLLPNLILPNAPVLPPVETLVELARIYPPDELRVFLRGLLTRAVSVVDKVTRRLVEVRRTRCVVLAWRESR